MNKPLSPAELASLSADTAVAVPAMSKHEKLMRFAKIVRGAPQTFVIYHGLEYQTDDVLDALEHPQSAFAAAATDPVLKDAGLPGGTVGNAKRFFELSTEDLHEFSCDCGGIISNAQMANRIESIAKRSA